MQSLDGSRKILDLIYGYRGLHALRNLVKFAQSYKSCVPQSGFSRRCLDEFLTYLNRDGSNFNDESAMALVREYTETIRYSDWSARNVWFKPMFTEIRPPHVWPKKVVSFSHDMPPDILEAYFNSMEEQFKGTPLQTKAISHHLDGKRILDFGCGMLHWAKMFRVIWNSYVVAVDRQDVMGRIRQHNNVENLKGIELIPSPIFEQRSKITKEGSESLVKPLEKFDTIWVSEVTHGKESPEALIVGLRHLLKPDGVFLINEINSSSSRAQFFNIHMYLHAGIKRDVFEDFHKCDNYEISENNRVFVVTHSDVDRWEERMSLDQFHIADKKEGGKVQ